MIAIPAGHRYEVQKLICVGNGYLWVDVFNSLYLDEAEHMLTALAEDSGRPEEYRIWVVVFKNFPQEKAHANWLVEGF